VKSPQSYNGTKAASSGGDRWSDAVRECNAEEKVLHNHTDNHYN
jgi:hypothetical protein